MEQLSMIKMKINEWIITVTTRRHNLWRLFDCLIEFNVARYRCKLALNVRGPRYLGLTRSISWLLMHWLFTSPGHQQPWYWLWKPCRSWSYLNKDFKYLCHISMWSNGIKCKYMFMFCLKNVARKELKCALSPRKQFETCCKQNRL